MPIDSTVLSSFASDYTIGMTSIRGRRVQRLLKREFASAEYALVVEFGSGTAGTLGLSASGAALCVTDGRGQQVSVAKWLHGSTQALETRFDLLKDSLPAVATRSLPVAGLGGPARPRVDAGSVPSRARVLVAMALRALSVLPTEGAEKQ